MKPEDLLNTQNTCREVGLPEPVKMLLLALKDTKLSSSQLRNALEIKHRTTFGQICFQVA